MIFILLVFLYQFKLSQSQFVLISGPVWIHHISRTDPHVLAQGASGVSLAKATEMVSGIKSALVTYCKNNCKLF